MSADFNLSIGDLGLSLNGRKSKKVTAVLGDPITRDDLMTLSEEREVKAPQLKKLRDRHHALARALASGISEGDASVLCGYDNSRVSILKSDRSFQDLVEFYRHHVDEKYYGMHERMAGLGQDAVDELADRLEDEPDSFSHNQLMDLASRMADRTGHGVSTKTEVNVRIGLADRMAAARKRVEEHLVSTKIIDVSPNK